MNETVRSKRLGRLVPAALLALGVVSSAPALAQQPYPPGAGNASRNPVCARLEGQLALIDRGTVDPARADQIRRLEEMAGRYQHDLDRVTAQGRRSGCEGRGFFSIFGGQPAQCGPINNQIQQLRANLDRVLGDLQRLQGNTADREGQRRTVLAALGQNDCGPQYRQFANRGTGFFEALFGPGTIINPSPEGVPGASGDSYRTVCVRLCDGYYFPISYSTVPGKFAEDEQVCQRLCPAAETTLYAHRNPGEDMTQAVASSSGRLYTELPNAFAYRKQLNPSCSCKAPGQTWADALKHLDDQTIERGDIVVTEERAKQLSQPVDSQGRPLKQPAQRPNTPALRGSATPASGTPAAADKAEGEPGKRQIRTVGPTFYPVR